MNSLIIGLFSEGVGDGKSYVAKILNEMLPSFLLKKHKDLVTDLGFKNSPPCIVVSKVMSFGEAAKEESAAALCWFLHWPDKKREWESFVRPFPEPALKELAALKKESWDETMAAIKNLMAQKPWPLWLRHFVQDYATEFRRGQDQNYWIYQFLGKLRKFEEHVEVSSRNFKSNAFVQPVIILDDVRFPNEAEACDFLIDIKNPEADLSDAQNAHSSQSHYDTLWEMSHAQIINRKTWGDDEILKQKITRALEKIWEKN